MKKIIAHVLIVIMVVLVIACSNTSKVKDFQKVKAQVEQLKFDYKPMPQFTADVSNSQNWNTYGQYVDSLFLPLSGGMPSYYALMFSDSLSQVIYVPEKVDDYSNQLGLFFDSPESILQRAITQQNAGVAMTQSEPIGNGYVSARIMGPDPRSFVSRDTWELLYYHELVHVFQNFNHSTQPIEAREAEAYTGEVAFLESKNPQQFKKFITSCEGFYQKYGFCKELLVLGSIAYKTEQVSPLERSMLEPTLMFAVAMKVRNIGKTDADKMKKILKEFNEFLSEINAVEYRSGQ